MSGIEWVAGGGYFLAFLFTIVRTEVLNPRLEWTPSAPYLERLAWDLLAASAGLRGWVVAQNVVQPSLSEIAVALSLAAVAGIGMCKVLARAFVPRVGRWLFGGW